MKNLFKFIVMVFVMFTCIAMSESLFVSATEGEYEFSYTYNGQTYYSNESVDDAWYQAMLYNYEQGILTEEDIEEEYAIFSRRDLTPSPSNNTYDNQSDLTGNPVTYVQGYLTWTTENGDILPLKNMRVDLYNKNVIGSEYLATVYTNTQGYYIFEFDNDEGFFENGGYDVYIKCYPDSYTFEIARDWVFSFLTYYYFQSDVVENVESGTTTNFSIRVLYDESNMANRAFYLSQGLELAQRFAIEMGMPTNDFLHVIYPFGSDQIAFCYDEYSGIAESYFKDFDTIMHEYGHFVEGVMGTYGSDLIDIVLYDPSHYSHTDHFYDKDDKQFAMDLTWSEAWATTFAQIAQYRYGSEYAGLISGFNDVMDGNEDYENYYPTINSCEAQEDAVIASLWDLFDSGSAETHDNMSLTYQQWWTMTTRNNCQTLSDFFSVINTYFPEYRSNVGEIFGYHQISPSDLIVTNSSLVSQTVAPQFSWSVNGSTNNPNDKFDLVFYNSTGSIVYQSSMITSTKSYYQTYTYSISSSVWESILSNFTNVAELNVVVRGYHSDSPLSGPYNSKYVTLSVEIEEETHTCSYTHGYLQYSSTKHKAYCTCGNFVLRHHAVSSSATGRYKPCVDCGYLVDTYSDIVIVGPLGTNDLLMTNNGSYILSNGIIVLVDEDIDGYLTGSLIFYNPRDNEELLQ
ncbi:MAG: hypothetical protein IKC22_02240 [Bacilli bacterium]|nr:hypothetical protein [Bacilli bacterium]MBR2891182.1 hypothetical protein [Bacilli bacterium]